MTPVNGPDPHQPPLAPVTLMATQGWRGKPRKLHKEVLALYDAYKPKMLLYRVQDVQGYPWPFTLWKKGRGPRYDIHGYMTPLACQGSQERKTPCLFNTNFNKGLWEVHKASLAVISNWWWVHWGEDGEMTMKRVLSHVTVHIYARAPHSTQYMAWLPRSCL